MRRREFISFLVGTVAAWPRAPRAHQSMAVVGWLNSETPDGYGPMVAAFRQGLTEMGFVEGRSVAIEYRWAERSRDNTLFCGFNPAVSSSALKAMRSTIRDLGIRHQTQLS